ncbi:MAG: nucleotidyltransferase family protein [Firmicutes bacterium]|nr:nucleotidyltransferase family protein [Bacillota bacterium]
MKQNKIVPDGVDVPHLENIFNATVMYSVKQEYITNEVVSILEVNKIKHILFKGVVVKNLYPTPELRTMGDIDIIIDSNDQNKR